MLTLVLVGGVAASNAVAHISGQFDASVHKHVLKVSFGNTSTVELTNTKHGVVAAALEAPMAKNLAKNGSAPSDLILNNDRAFDCYFEAQGYCPYLCSAARTYKECLTGMCDVGEAAVQSNCADVQDQLDGDGCSSCDLNCDSLCTGGGGDDDGDDWWPSWATPVAAVVGVAALCGCVYRAFAAPRSGGNAQGLLGAN